MVNYIPYLAGKFFLLPFLLPYTIGKYFRKPYINLFHTHYSKYCKAKYSIKSLLGSVSETHSIILTAKRGEIISPNLACRNIGWWWSQQRVLAMPYRLFPLTWDSKLGQSQLGPQFLSNSINKFLCVQVIVSCHPAFMCTHVRMSITFFTKYMWLCVWRQRETAIEANK
jgi:hypothetical protein